MPLSFREICRPQCVLSIVNFAFRWTLLTSYCAVPGTVFLDLWWHSSTRSFSVLWTMVCSTIEEICTRNRSSGLEKSWFLCNVSCCTSCTKSPRIETQSRTRFFVVSIDTKCQSEIDHYEKKRSRTALTLTLAPRIEQGDKNDDDETTGYVSSQYGVCRHQDAALDCVSYVFIISIYLALVLIQNTCKTVSSVKRPVTTTNANPQQASAYHFHRETF